MNYWLTIALVTCLSGLRMPVKDVRNGNSGFEKPGDSSVITFSLRKGGQLAIAYPRNTVQSTELLVPKVLEDSLVRIVVAAETPFILYNINKTFTRYLLFPGNNYNAEIKEGQIDFYFQCDDKQKAFACNALSKLESATAKSGILARRYLNKTTEYTRYIDSIFLQIREIRLQQIEQYRKLNELSDEDYNYLSAYTNFDFIRNRLAPFSNINVAMKNLPKWYSDSLDLYQHLFDDSTYLRLYSFQAALIYNNRYLSYKASKEMALVKQFSAARHFSTSTQVNDFLLYQILNNRKNRQDRQYPVYVDSFQMICSNSFYKSIIARQFEYSATQNKSSSVQQLFTVSDRVIAFDSVKKSQNKIIYIDFWASWCAPCKREMARSHQLQLELKNVNVSFLYLSIDEDVAPWKNGVEEFSFMNSNNSFLLSGSYNSVFAKRYVVHSIPRYMLIDNTGKIINDDAPRPSDPKTKELILEVAK